MQPPIPGLERVLTWANIIYLVGIGVTFAASFAIYWLSARVNAAKDQELARFQADSGARIAASQADAARAQEESANAMAIVESERLARVQLESQVASAEARAAEANASAAKAQLELARIKEPRTLSPEAQDRLIEKLRPFSEQKFGFSVYPDPEPLALLRTLDVLLKAAGWQRVPSQIGSIEVDAAGETAGTAHDSGLSAFIGPDNEEARTALITLATSLTAEGMHCRPSRTEQLRGKIPKAIIINVGRKP